jgi:hypothetical protein
VQLDELFAEDEHLQRTLDMIMQSSIQYPNVEPDENAPSIDGTTRTLILLLEHGLM